MGILSEGEVLELGYTITLKQLFLKWLGRIKIIK